MSEAMARASRLLPSRLRAIGNWPVWSLPGWLTAFVLAVVVADLAAIGVAARAVTFSGHDLGLFCLLLGCTAIAVELTRNAGEQGGVMTDVQGVWELPVAIFLPPLYALIVPIARISLTQWRGRRGPGFPRGFTRGAGRASHRAA